MSDTLEQAARFLRERLAPCAIGALRQAFQAYGAGVDLNVETKDDGTPASRADRETEALLRALIAEAYPGQGISGEELGTENIAADYVWVLDPLDGTQEFLAKEKGWGSLIALMYRGYPVLGAILDPLQNKMWDQTARVTNAPPRPLAEAVIATTAPRAMFDGTAYETGFKALEARCSSVRPRLNALGFACAAEGTVDAAVENQLKLHDIAALLPPLWARGAVCKTLDGADYKDRAFDLADSSARYSLVTSLDAALVEDIVTFFREGRS